MTKSVSLQCSAWVNSSKFLYGAFIVALNAFVLTEDIEYTEKSPFLKGKVD